MGLYPVNLKLKDRPCVIVGGGRVALRKAEALLECGARLRVVAPELHPDFASLAGRHEHVARAWQAGDLEGAFLAIIATNDEEVNKAVAAEARRLGVLLNVVDRPAECDFFVPASVRRGELLITVSTGGELPALSKRLRQTLEAEFPREWSEALKLLGRARREVISRIGDETARAACLGELAALDMVELLRDGGAKAAGVEIDRCISRYLA